MSHHRILIIEDEKANQRTLARLLGTDYRLEICDDAETGWMALDTAEAIDLVLLDLRLPGMDGFEMLKRIRSEARFELLPVVILTGMTDEADEERGLELGASDYISKPFRPAAVKLRIKNQLALLDQRRMLQELAVSDPLTGLYNRRGFNDIFKRELARANRSGTSLSLALIDVDFFKKFNDCYGHPEGDKALQFIGQQLKAVSRRAADLAARIGGEEFLLLWPETTLKGAQQQAEKVRHSIEQHAYPHACSDISNYLTVSIGGVTLEAGNYDAEVAIRQADDALYEAKRTGRNRVVWAPTV
ncbi:MAG TPA: diguanylate cyclase [Marinobacterium sp.]|nr:diguanylate cyclase [Marinobacterium sp.]